MSIKLILKKIRGDKKKVAKDEKKSNQLSQTQVLPKEYDTTISLLDLYLTEWMHRDEFFLMQIFKFFYAILIIIVLPNISNALQLDLPLEKYKFIYRVVGLILSFIFLYVEFAYVKRLQVVGDAYRKILNTLPENYKQPKLEKIKNGKFFSRRVATIISIVLFVILFCLSILLIFVDIK